MDYWMVETLLWNSALAGNPSSGTFWRTSLWCVWGKPFIGVSHQSYSTTRAPGVEGFAVGSSWLLGVSGAKAREAAYSAGAGLGKPLALQEFG